MPPQHQGVSGQKLDAGNVSSSAKPENQTKKLLYANAGSLPRHETLWYGVMVIVANTEDTTWELE